MFKRAPSTERVRAHGPDSDVLMEQPSRSFRFTEVLEYVMNCAGCERDR